MEKKEEQEIEREVIQAKISSLEKELIELKKLQPLMFTALSIGINRMETSLKDRLIELSSNLNKASLENKDA